MRNVNVRDYEEAAKSIVVTLGPEWAHELLRLLEADDLMRADCSDSFRRGTHEALLDAMTDLEADPGMRGWLVEYLKMELGEHSIACLRRGKALHDRRLPFQPTRLDSCQSSVDRFTSVSDLLA
jgi:hypothetical protein